MSLTAPDYPTPITVIDALMGQRKTRYLQRLMNQQHYEAAAKGEEPPRFIYIAVTLDERNRCAEACPNLNFREPVVAAKQKPRKNARIAAIKARAEAAKADPEREHERKYASLVQLVAQGANIASTHALFKLLRRDLTGEFKRFRYRLVIDEALDVVGKYDQLTKEDPQILAQQRLIVLDELGRWRWNYAEHPNYKGKFEFLRPLCDNGNLVQARGDVLLWTFPAQFLANFEQVYIATYLFEGQAMSDYLKANGIPYRLRSMSDDKEHLVEHATSRNTKQKHALADLIQIEADPRLNAIGSPTHGLEQPLSKTWYDRLMRNGGDPKDLLGQARRNLGYFFERRARTPSALNMWTCFDGKDGRDYQHESKLRKTLKDDRYTRGFVPVNSKATNSHRRKASLAYMCNGSRTRLYWATSKITVSRCARSPALADGKGAGLGFSPAFQSLPAFPPNLSGKHGSVPRTHRYRHHLLHVGGDHLRDCVLAGGLRDHQYPQPFRAHDRRYALSIDRAGAAPDPPHHA
jgi:hypothetical protein